MRVARYSVPLVAILLLAGFSNGQGRVDHESTGLLLGSFAGGLVGEGRQAHFLN